MKMPGLERMMQYLIHPRSKDTRGNADRFCEDLREEWAVFHGVFERALEHLERTTFNAERRDVQNESPCESS